MPSIQHASKYEMEDVDGSDDGEEDETDLIFSSDLKSALQNLGGGLRIEEIEMLTKGVKEDDEEGMLYADVVGVLIFASFFISTFDREGRGHVMGDDLGKMILNLREQYTSAFKDNTRARMSVSEFEDCNLIDIGLEPNEKVELTKLIATIENSGQVDSIH